MTRSRRGQRHVLVVEDHVSIRDLITHFLTDEGYVVDQASNGATGMRLAERLHPDVILLDLALPERSGLDVVRELRSNPRTTSIPVIVISALADELSAIDREALAAVIQKPFDLPDLLGQVEQVLAAARKLDSWPGASTVPAPDESSSLLAREQLHGSPTSWR